MALKQVKNKIISTKKTGQVTKAMESVSAVKMRKSQERALAGKSYAEAALRILNRLSKSQDAKQFFTVDAKEDAKHCFIIITSDKGLAGSLNSSVLKEATLKMELENKDSVEVIAFGRKSLEYSNRLEYKVVEEFTNIGDDVVIDDVAKTVQAVMDKYQAGEYKKVSVAYQSFVSTFEQNPVIRDVLPLDTAVLEKMIEDIVPKKGKYSETTEDLAAHSYTVEPSVDEVFMSLLPKLVQIMIFHSLLESKASEHSARMVAMKNATDKSKEVIKALTIKYNKARQASITAEVSEITAGVEAMK